ncbi:MAG: hypothetical protein V1659_00700 [Candidatus Woesearchaeota archaeon]
MDDNNFALILVIIVAIVAIIAIIMLANTYAQKQNLAGQSDGLYFGESNWPKNSENIVIDKNRMPKEKISSSETKQTAEAGIFN